MSDATGYRFTREPVRHDRKRPWRQSAQGVKSASDDTPHQSRQSRAAQTEPIPSTARNTPSRRAKRDMIQSDAPVSRGQQPRSTQTLKHATRAQKAADALARDLPESPIDTHEAAKPATAATQILKRAAGMPWLAIAFVVSLMIPITVRAGPVLLLPYRLLLVVMFIPLVARWFSGKAGQILLMDKLILFSAIWGALALAVNHPLGQIFEAMGIHILEFFGAYVMGRVAIQSGNDFRRFAKIMFLVALILLPLAAAEGVLGRPVALDLIPKSISPVNIGERFGLRRAQTFFSHPIHHGAFVSAALGLAWFSVSYNAPFFTRVTRVAIVCVCTAFSLSSGAMMAMVFQFIFIAWELIMRQVDNRWTVFAILSAISYVVIDLLATKTPFHVVVNYATFSSGSAYNRILIWNYGTQNVWANPIFGLGFNDWVRPGYMSPSVDNFWLLIAMRHGLPASIAFMVAVILIVRRVGRAPLTDLVDRASRAGYLVSLGGIVMAGATVHYWHGIGAFVMFFIGAGVWAAQPAVTSTDNTLGETPKPEKTVMRRGAASGAVPA